MNEVRVKALKYAGLVGSMLVGVTMIINGQIEGGVGIIAASLSSGSALGGK